MWPGKSVLIIHTLGSLVYSLPPNIDWSNLQYDPDSVAQNENILKIFLQLAMHTANRLINLRNETDRDYDCKGRNDNPVHLITETPITQSLLKTNLERPDKSQDRIQNRLFINDSEINNNQDLLENLNQDQMTLLYSTQSQELFDNSSNFQEAINVARDSKTSNLISTLVQNQTLSDVLRRNPDTLQKIKNLNTTNNVSNANEFSFDVQNSQNSTIDGISARLFNSIDLMKNISNATIMNNLTETVHKFLPKSQNVQESTPEVSQRLIDIDLAKNVPDTKIVNDSYENVNRFNTRRSQNTQEQSNRNDADSKSLKYRDPTTTIQNFEHFLNPQIVNNLPIVNQILLNAKNFVESIIKALPEAKNAESGNNFLNHIISHSQNVNAKIIASDPANFNYIQHHQIRNVEQVGNDSDNVMRNHQNFNNNSRNNVNEPTDASKGNNKNTENNNLSINTDNSKAENSDNQSAFINERPSVENNRDINHINDVIKPEVFEKVDKVKTNHTNEQLNSISENLFQINETNESSITEYQGKNSNRAQDSEKVNKFNVEKPKKPQDNLSTNVRISRSIGNRNIRIDNDVLKLNNYSRFVDNLKDPNLLRQLFKTKVDINDRLIDASLLTKKEKIRNSESHMTDHYNYNMINRQRNKNLPSSNTISNSKLN
ncbi:putative uncharacterized protein DDB_G0282129 [Nylanderia fulva]|uniref:putative uncharacterized protein DDB_G0282129 n=1 Tax=Nylanderia fulva TaxID=613905 RepID=UPI0010FB33C7|nr:putative uncharacterized protein DDB_G0282129 [Nylanderia fulva]